MAEPAANKTPMGMQEGAARGATYGALFSAMLLLVSAALFVYGLVDKRVDRVETGLLDLRSDIAQLRSEFVEFRAETRGELRAVHVALDSMRAEQRANHDELKKLLAETRPR
jgi:hypothetical protein